MDSEKINPDKIEIKIIRSAAEQDLALLYQQAGWWEPSVDDTGEFINHIVGKSALFVGVFDKKKMIGMGRALSDLVSDAYIQDVTVLKSYRGNGIGGKIVKLLVRELKKYGVDWIGLVAEPGTVPFYEQLGFGELKGFTVLKYKEQ